MTEMTLAQLAQGVLSGVVLGGLYASMATGLSLIYSTLKILNFAHGAIFTWGGYVMWLLIASYGLNYSAALVCGMIFAFIVGVAIEISLVSPVRGRPQWDIAVIIATIGLALVLENAARLVFGAHVKTIPPSIGGSITAYNVFITWHSVVVLAAAMLTLIGSWFFLEKHKQGMGMRAVAENSEVAYLMGINVNRMYVYSFGLGSAMAGVAGMLLATVFYVSPDVGGVPLLKAFIIIVFGGLGKVKGTIYAAFLLGVIESITALIFGLGWALPVMFLVMVITLILKPSGLFGR